MNKSSFAFQRAVRAALREIDEQTVYRTGYGLYVVDLLPPVALVFSDPLHWRLIPGKKRIKREHHFIEHNDDIHVYTLRYHTDRGLESVLAKFERYFEGTDGRKIFQKTQEVKKNLKQRKRKSRKSKRKL